MFKRNIRPRDPTFAFCPMPRRGEGTQERNAAPIMTYFHPFTLNPDEADSDVPFLGNLCEAGRSWHDSMLRWFDGRIPCEETKKYVSNFLSVTRARPEDVDDDHAEEDFSDEELIVNKHNFRDALKTSIGRGARNVNANEEEASGDDEGAPKSTLLKRYGQLMRTVRRLGLAPPHLSSLLKIWPRHSPQRVRHRKKNTQMKI